MKIATMLFLFCISTYAQNAIEIDGHFDDWAAVKTVMHDPSHDEHDTDWYSDGLSQPVPRTYSDVDILEARFTHDRDNLYGYVKARGVIGRTARDADGYKSGRYYFIITIDVDENDATGYPLEQGNYWPNSVGYDMNMEVEFYNGEFNTGHYIHHGYLSESALEQGRVDLYNRIIRLAPGNYDDYLQWVVFDDSSIVEVSDRGPVYQGIITVAVSEDGHEAEMKAPMWGFFWDETGQPIVKLGNRIDVSFSLEGSGELSESALEAGYNGTKSMWGSDTAEPIEGYELTDIWTNVADNLSPKSITLFRNYPNPFNLSTTLEFELLQDGFTTVTIHSSNGALVRHLLSEYKTRGRHAVQWAATDDQGKILPSGLYFARLTHQLGESIIKMFLIK